MSEYPSTLAEAAGLRDPDLVRPEEHVRLARAITRRVFRRPTEDDFAIALLALVEAAEQWNRGKRPCRWSTFASKRLRWSLVYRYGRTSWKSMAAEVPLLVRPEADQDYEIQREEMAVEDPAFASAEARADVAALLEGLAPTETLVLRRRFGFEGERETLAVIGEDLGIGPHRVRQVEVKALGRLRKRVTRRTFTIPLDSGGSERLR